MRLAKNTFFLMLLSLVIFSGCKKDNEGGESPAENGTIQATVEGSSFKSVKIATFATKTTAEGTTTLIIQGNTGETDAKAIVITIFGFEGKGVYKFGEQMVPIVTGSYSEIKIDLDNPNNPEIKFWNAPYEDSGVAGEIEVTKLSETNIEGVFNFKAKNNDDGSFKTVNSGSFNIDFK